MPELEGGTSADDPDDDDMPELEGGASSEEKGDDMPELEGGTSADDPDDDDMPELEGGTSADDSDVPEAEDGLVDESVEDNDHHEDQDDALADGEDGMMIETVEIGPSSAANSFFGYSEDLPVEGSHSMETAAAAPAAAPQTTRKKKGPGELNAARELTFGLTINDKMMLPPQVTGFYDDHAEIDWEKVKLQQGDLLYGFGFDKKKLANCKTWAPKRVTDELGKLASGPGRAVRPLYVSRRRLRGDETIVMQKTKGDLGLEFKPTELAPPEVARDTEKKKFWTLNGIQPGAKLVLLNGFNTEAMSYAKVRSKYGALLKNRPVTMVFRMAHRSRDKMWQVSTTRKISLSFVRYHYQDHQEPAAGVSFVRILIWCPHFGNSVVEWLCRKGGL